MIITMDLQQFILLLIFTSFSALPPSFCRRLIQHKKKYEIDEQKTLKEFGISGGNITTIIYHKYAASLTVDGNVIGAGALINRRWLATAASIKELVNVKDISIRVSSDYAQKDGCELKVQDWIPHNYYRGDLKFDLALVKFNKNIPRKCKTTSVLLTNSLPIDRSRATVVGWGWGLNQTKGNEIIVAADVPVLNFLRCNDIYPGLDDFTNVNFCTNGDKGPCQNDLGAPLFYNNALIGIFTKTFLCGRPDFPSIYTDVTQFKKWIEDTIKK